VPELRDYHQINAELVRRLRLGQRHVRLEGVEGQRLLVAGLAGPWQALVEVDGNAGPELAAEMNAPGLTVVCRGTAADGAGRGLVAGTLVVLGPASAALGYLQQGGLIVAAGEVGPRPGLCQRGGELVLLGKAGSLAGERRSGGRLFLHEHQAGPHLGFGSRGGRSIPLGKDLAHLEELAPEDRSVVEGALELSGKFSAPA
jgi:methylamine---glutamate N-methyltransferase subunit B